MSIDIVISAQSFLEAMRLRDPMREILADAFVVWPFPIWTLGSVYRPYHEERSKSRSGIHGTDDLDGQGHRAIDGPTPDWPIAQDVAKYVNARWIYDPLRPRKLVAYAAEHGTGSHVHFQTHANTVHRQDRTREV